MMQPGQKSLFGGVRKCLCGFHIQKQPSSTRPEASTASVSQAAVTSPTSPAASFRQAAVTSPTSPAAHGAIGHKQRQPMNLSMFTKPRFSGSHLAAAKPNLAMARKVTQKQVTQDTDMPGSAVSTTISAVDIQTEEPALIPEIPVVAPVSLPRLWSEGFPPEDHRWIAKALFRMGAKDKPQLQDNLKLWYYPPELTASLPIHCLYGCPHWGRASQKGTAGPGH
ncbi:uncharacterized protein LOC118557550 [Fundulus heteroclitus]|uniref:uncharacterized protein LOC118557550 n=1 Tax=Fundulus heteroclitus TaxID=8078 RepID=UPI00165BB295|nr:uncharacterized protein LOC118557550 [Fundulus heteroclitus]